MKLSIEERLKKLGLPFVVHRNRPCLNDGPVEDFIGDYPVSYARRRYGQNAMFVWVHYYSPKLSSWNEISEPWPSIMPRKAEALKCIIEDEQTLLASRCTTAN